MDPSDEYGEFVKKHADYDKNVCTKKNLRKIAYDFIKLKTGKISKKPKCYWLVFESETGSREECNTYYSDLKYASIKNRIILRVASSLK